MIKSFRLGPGEYVVADGMSDRNVLVTRVGKRWEAVPINFAAGAHAVAESKAMAVKLARLLIDADRFGRGEDILMETRTRKRHWSAEYKPTVYGQGVHVGEDGTTTFPVTIAGEGDRPIDVTVPGVYMARIVEQYLTVMAGGGVEVSEYPGQRSC